MKKKLERTIDELLVIQSQSNDKKALSLLIKRWHPKLAAYIYRNTNDKEATKDILQESWHTIIKGLRGLKDPARFNVWIYKIAKGKTVDWIRNQQKRRKMGLQTEVVAEPYQNLENDNKEDTIKSLQIAMRSLSGEQREVLSLFYLDNQSVREIAHILSVPEGTIKSRLYHAREHLKKIIRK